MMKSKVITTILLLINFGIVCLWLSIPLPYGQAQYKNWNAITSDSTGKYLAAANGENGGNIYTSNDYGSTWTPTSAPFAYWRAITSDSTGKYLAAVYYNKGNGIYTSNDYGSTWTQTSAPLANWYSITSDSTGKYLAAVSGDPGGIYTSNDYGSTWTPTSAPLANWNAITSDSTGRYLAAASGDSGGIYTSNDYGNTWTPTSAYLTGWYSITSDSTGKYLAAGIVGGGKIYTSNDYGSTWTQTSAPLANWYSITSDSTGKYLAAVSGDPGGEIYTSNDYGSTWTPTSAPLANWGAITSDSTGQYLVSLSSLIFVSTDFGASWKVILDLNPTICTYPLTSYTVGTYTYRSCRGVDLDFGAVGISMVALISSIVYLWAHLWIVDNSGHYNWKLGVNLFIYTLLPALDMMSTLVMLFTTLFASRYICIAAWIAYFSPAWVFLFQLIRDKTKMRQFAFVWIIPIPERFVYEEYDMLSKVASTAVVGFIPAIVSTTVYVVKNGFFVLQGLWFMVGYFLFSIKVLSIGKVENLWLRVFTGSNDMVHKHVLNQRQLNEQYLSITVLQSLPMVVIILVNSHVLRNITSVQIVSSCFSGMMIVAGIYRYAYYIYNGKAIGEVPIPLNVNYLFKVDLKDYQDDETTNTTIVNDDENGIILGVTSSMSSSPVLSTQAYQVESVDRSDVIPLLQQEVQFLRTKFAEMEAHFEEHEIQIGELKALMQQQQA